jgi:hypothetical protein
MLPALSTVVVVGASLILTLLCGVVILPVPEAPARQPIDRQLNGEAAWEMSGRYKYDGTACCDRRCALAQGGPLATSVRNFMVRV